MSMYYSHVLIPTSPTYLPDVHQAVRWIQGLIEVGALDGPLRLVLANHDAPSRRLRGRNPRTGETIVHVSPTRTELDVPAELVVAARSLRNFDVELRGQGPGRKPLLPAIGAFEEGVWKPWQEPCDLEVECSIRSRVVSTSDLHEDSPGNRQAVPFGDECDPDQTVGLYSHPGTLEVIEVPQAGCASFWIEINFGKWLFPRIEENNLALLQPEYVRAAEAIFGIPFAEGCRWG